MMCADLRGDRREERGDEDEHKHDERLVGLIRRSTFRRFVSIVIRHKYSPARPESPFGILKSLICNRSVNALSMCVLDNLLYVSAGVPFVSRVNA